MSQPKRPISPFMLGSYYKFQITSLLSILNRLTGIFLSLVTAPIVLYWLVTLATGEQSFMAFSECLGGVLGKLVMAVSVFCFSFHLFCGIRHLIWDTGRMVEMPQVRTSGWLAVIASVVLTVVVLGAVL